MTKFRWAAVSAIAVLALTAAACGGDDSDAASTTTGGSTEAGGEAAVFEFKPLDAADVITKEALKKGDIQVALLLSSDAEIAANDWVVLEDDKDLQQLENLTPAIRIDKTTDPIEEALDAVSEKLTTDELIEMNRRNSLEDESPRDVAETWLKANGLLPYTGGKATGSLNVGSTNFPEQEIVAELYAQVLESAGVSVSRRFQLGSRELVAPALEEGDIDLYPEYLGTYTLFLDETATVPTSPDDAADQLRELLEAKGITMLTPSEAQDTNAFVVTKATADRYGLTSVSDLASVEDTLVLGGPPECPQRPFCLIGLKETYGLKFNV